MLCSSKEGFPGGGVGRRSCAECFVLCPVRTTTVVDTHLFPTPSPLEVHVGCTGCVKVGRGRGAQECRPLPLSCVQDLSGVLNLGVFWGVWRVKLVPSRGGILFWSLSLGAWKSGDGKIQISVAYFVGFRMEGIVGMGLLWFQLSNAAGWVWCDAVFYCERSRIQAYSGYACASCGGGARSTAVGTPFLRN